MLNTELKAACGHCKIFTTIALNAMNPSDFGEPLALL